MADTKEQIERVWGGYNPGTFNRESALKKHLEESQASRERQEQEATQARYAAEDARREAERQTQLIAEQTRVAEEAAEEARSHAASMAWENRQVRSAPETLFDLSQRRERMAQLCHLIINTNGVVSEQAIDNALDTFKPFYQELSHLKSTFLLDFGHKKLLKEMREEFDWLWETLRGLQLAQQAARLSEMQPQIRGFCRDLLDSPDTLDREAILYRRTAIQAFCDELRGISSYRELPEIKKIRSEFQKLANTVNASTDWQIKCDAHNANAKAMSTFAPLQQFKPKQMRDYFEAVDHASALESKAASLKITLEWGTIAWECFAWLLFAAFVLSFIFSEKALGYVCVVPPLLYVAWAAIIAPISNAFASRLQTRAQGIRDQINRRHPNTDPALLRRLHEKAEWNGTTWDIPYDIWARMLNLGHLKIIQP